MYQGDQHRTQCYVYAIVNHNLTIMNCNTSWSPVHKTYKFNILAFGSYIFYPSHNNSPHRSLYCKYKVFGIFDTFPAGAPNC